MAGPGFALTNGMATLVYAFRDLIARGDSTPYGAAVWGAQRSDGRWEGWLVFRAADGSSVLSTPRETVQSNLEALRYWATGLEPVYLEGALDRAHLVDPVDKPEAASDQPAA